MGERAVGIDLGTSNSCVAISDGRSVEVLSNGYGENITASVVGFREDGSVLVGNSAKANLIHEPQKTVASAKRLIGRYFFSEEVKKAQAVCSYDIVEGPGHGVRIVIDDEEFSLPEVSAMILREMKNVAENAAGGELTKAVITVPAYFNDNQRQATKDAGRIAGLDVLRLLNEPTAAALAYGFGRGLNQKVAIYDLGGGTFDISILEIGTDVFEVLATCGDTYLGGDDFDDRLIDLFADEFMAQHGINLRADMYALEKLKLAAENAKRGLSEEEVVEVRIPDVARNETGEPLSFERTVTIQEFAALVNDLILRTFKVCDEALQQAGVTTRDLEGVILVGGPTRLDIIRDAVSNYFGQDPKNDVDPDEVVAMGAAIHAASLVAEEPGDDDAFLLDVTPLSLKIGVAGGLAENVIERNTPVPIEQTRTFTTYQDMQQSVKIKVFQGEDRQAEGNELLGQFEFSGFDARPRGQVRIDVTFEIDADGILGVKAADQETGLQASTTITLNSGLSEDELGQILDEGRADRVQPGAPGAASAVAGTGARDEADAIVAADDDSLFGSDPAAEMEAAAAAEGDASDAIALPATDPHTVTVEPTPAPVPAPPIAEAVPRAVAEAAPAPAAVPAAAALPDLDDLGLDGDLDDLDLDLDADIGPAGGAPTDTEGLVPVDPGYVGSEADLDLEDEDTLSNATPELMTAPPVATAGVPAEAAVEVEPAVPLPDVDADADEDIQDAVIDEKGTLFETAAVDLTDYAGDE